MLQVSDFLGREEQRFLRFVSRLSLAFALQYLQALFVKVGRCTHELSTFSLFAEVAGRLLEPFIVQ
jgi:hypothetical protein